jgi:uracil-DNA glycosylase
MPKVPPRPSNVMSYKQHREKWSACKKCPLHTTRSNVVFVRGTLPCDILFIGEAPGVSEDTIGKPFIGPAGKLLDQMIEDSLDHHTKCEVCGNRQMSSRSGITCKSGHDGAGSVKLTYALTNLVSCIPIDDNGEKSKEPSKVSINACWPKLTELISIAKPKAIVCVGKLAEIAYGHEMIYSVNIRHPAAILRSDISARGLLIQQVIATLNELAFSVASGEDLAVPF